MVPDGWVGPKSSGCRCHFRAFQLKLFILDIQNFGNGPVVKKLQLFENAKFSKNPKNHHFRTYGLSFNPGPHCSAAGTLPLGARFPACPPRAPSSVYSGGRDLGEFSLDFGRKDSSFIAPQAHFDPVWGLAKWCVRCPFVTLACVSRDFVCGNLTIDFSEN